MAIIKQFDKRSGITYFYESKSFWDKEKKQSRSKRTLIGRLDPKTGKMVPTDGRGKRRKDRQSNPQVQPTPQTKRLYYGATYLFDQIGEQTGVTQDLKACFPNQYKQILSLAYYLILEDQNPLSRFTKWSKTHVHPCGKDIPSQRSSEIFQSITEASKMAFFRLQGQRRLEQEYWAYDSTSISSYSESLSYVQYGKNKDNDPLPQVNLSLLFGEKSGLPFYYRKTCGNIPDVKTVKELLYELDLLGYSKVKLVMDRGYYSADNINALYKDHVKFICGAPITLRYAKDFIAEVGHSKSNYDFYNSNFEIYVFTKTIGGDYEQKRPYKGDILEGKRRMYLHLYFNPEKAVDDAKRFNKKLDLLKEELLKDKRNPLHEKDYQRFFDVGPDQKIGSTLHCNQEAVKEACASHGFFLLISNEVKDPTSALMLYRMRDVVEKAFGNIKERLNLQRTLVSSESSLEGKFFVEFVALIFLSYLKKRMEEQHLFKTYTMHEVLDELDVIEAFQEPGRSLHVGEVLQKQEDLYRALGVQPLLAHP